MSPQGMLLGNICRPPPTLSDPHQTPHVTNESCLSADTKPQGPADPPT